MPNRIMKRFVYAHLPEKYQEPSRKVAELAQWVDENLPESAEKTVTLRHLWEAKNELVLAWIDKVEADNA